MPLTPGTRLGPYEILAALGAGGMGEVWKARDTRLDRLVAVKQLKGTQAARFQVEARAIAALNHPHICSIYDVGEDYLVLEYVEGRPLRGPLPADEASKLALQIAGALEEAHAKGVLHRDLKPANIMVTPRGTVKLLDFGLAKLLAPAESDETRTTDGTVLGTAGYMSPEQAQGSPLDERSDIFSFGIVLYEMLAGTPAFTRGSLLNTLNAVVRDEPVAIETSPALEKIVRRCLRKVPAERFQTFAEVRLALEDRSSARPAVPAEPLPSIAVLPFANMSADKEQEYFSDGLAEEIINLLTRIPGLKVIARTSAFAFRGMEQDIRRIAEALGVRTILEGSVRRAGNRIRVSAQLISADDGSHLFSERYDREMNDIFAMQDEIASAIASALRIRLSQSSSGSMQPVQYTPVLPAYDAYLKGRHHVMKTTPDSLELGRQYYEQAIALDPGFALPHSGLAIYYFFLTNFARHPARETVPLARAEAMEALRIDPSLSEAHAMLGQVSAMYDMNWSEAERHFARALAHQPAPALTRQTYALFQFLRGNAGEAIEIASRLIEEDPLEVLPRINLQLYLQAAGREAEAFDQLKKVIGLNENLPVAHVTMASLLAARGSLPEALASARRAHSIAPLYGDGIAAVAALLRLTGDENGAQGLSHEALLRELDGPAFGNAASRALFHVFCDELDQTADYMEKAIEERDLTVIFRLRHTLFKRLYRSPRWPKIVAMLNLPEDSFHSAAAGRA